MSIYSVRLFVRVRTPVFHTPHQAEPLEASATVNQRRACGSRRIRSWKNWEIAKDAVSALVEGQEDSNPGIHAVAAWGLEELRLEVQKRRPCLPLPSCPDRAALGNHRWFWSGGVFRIPLWKTAFTECERELAFRLFPINGLVFTYR